MEFQIVDTPSKINLVRMSKHQDFIDRLKEGLLQAKKDGKCLFLPINSSERFKLMANTKRIGGFRVSTRHGFNGGVEGFFVSIREA